MESVPNLILVGAMGAGKSSIGKRLAAHLGLRFVDADRDIELHTGASIGTIFDCEGESGFRQRERIALERLLADDGQVIATGGGVVLDAGNRRDLRARGYVIWLQVDVQTQLDRLSRDRSRPLLRREDREQVLRDIATVRTPLYAEVADLVFDTRQMSCADAASALASRLQGAGTCALPPGSSETKGIDPQRDAT